MLRPRKGVFLIINVLLYRVTDTYASPKQGKSTYYLRLNGFGAGGDSFHQSQFSQRPVCRSLPAGTSDRASAFEQFRLRYFYPASRVLRHRDILVSHLTHALATSESKRLPLLDCVNHCSHQGMLPSDTVDSGKTSNRVAMSLFRIPLSRV